MIVNLTPKVIKIIYFFILFVIIDMDKKKVNGIL